MSEFATRLNIALENSRTIFYNRYRCSLCMTVKCPVRSRRQSKHRKAWINKSHRKRKQPINAGRMGRNVDGQQKNQKKRVSLFGAALFFCLLLFVAICCYLLLFVANLAVGD